MIRIGPGQYSLVESEDNWRKHMMIVLWVAIIAVIVLSAALLYADYQGWFSASTVQPASSGWPTWP